MVQSNPAGAATATDDTPSGTSTIVKRTRLPRTARRRAGGIAADAASVAISIGRDRLRTGEFMPSVKSVSRRSSRPTYTCRHQGMARGFGLVRRCRSLTSGVGLGPGECPAAR